MELMPRYKQTEAGVIPEDWEVKQIREIAKVKGGKRLPFGKSLVDTSTPHPYIRVTDMHLGSVNLANIRYVPEDAYPPIKNYRISSDDIFVSVAGTLGIVGKVPKELDGANLTENADKITEIQCDRDYLLCCLIGERIQNGIVAQQTQGAQPKLALNRIEGFVIPLPPLSEQRAIATALSDTDALLSSLDQLLAKKRDIKKAAMQQLLAGKQRLPGFIGEWADHLLGDLGIFKKGKGIKKDEVVPDGIPCIRYGELYTRHNDYVKTFHSFIPCSIANNSQQLKKGDLLFAGSGETSEEIGKCVAFLSDDEAYAGGDIVIFSPVKQDSLYLGYLMNQPNIVAQKSRMGQGDAVVHISAGSLAKLRMCLPPLSEQTAIAAVLSDMDAEIDALQQRRDKTRAVKQGMMQELLTGKTRLV